MSKEFEVKCEECGIRHLKEYQGYFDNTTCDSCKNKKELKKEVKIKPLTDREKILIYQLFMGKVIDEIGVKRTMELLKESKKAFRNGER